jgi:hypothetical protein
MPMMTWMDWGNGALRYGPPLRWKGWAGKIEVRLFAGGQHGDLLLLDGVLLHPRAVFTVVGQGGEPDATVAFEVRPQPEHPPGNPYLLTHRVKDVRPEVIGIHIAAKPNGRGITTADLRSFALDEFTTDAFTRVGVPEVPPFRAPEEDYRYIARTVREARSGSRGRVTRAELEVVARVYREHIGTTPTRAVQLAGGYSERTAARRVQQARAAGLLPETTPGKRKA